MQTSSDVRVDGSEESVTLSVPGLIKTIREYSSAILLTVVAAAVGYVILALAYYVLTPSVKVTDLPFRFDFESSKGRYPNGAKFNTAEVITPPVLQEVHKMNGLARFIDYPTFARSVFIVESNPDYDRILSEYRARLSDPKLMPVDRERIVSDFELKLASVDRSTFAVTFVCGPNAKCPPLSLIRKSLSDVLRVWARRATNEKRVLLYRAPILSTSVLQTDQMRTTDPLSRSLLLRARVVDVLRNLEVFARIPGAELVRTPDDQISYLELSVYLRDLLRFQVEPLIESLVASSTSPRTREQLQAQLRFDRMVYDAATSRRQALLDALAAYEQNDRVTDPTVRATGQGQSLQTAPTGEESITPQLSDSFLDRLITLTSRSGDREYRQRLVDEIKLAAIETVPLEAAVGYDQRLLEHAGTGAATVPPEQFEQIWEASFASLKRSTEKLGVLYQSASSQMYPEMLYASAGPTKTRVDRVVSLPRMAMIFIIVIMIALVGSVVWAIIHKRLREVEASAVDQPTTA